ncbi:MAG: peptidoglycan-binding protein, partial [Acidobacteriota bacterium]
EGVEKSGEALRAAVIQFQRANHLVVDGVVGPKTLMALYSRSGRYLMPRLYSLDPSLEGSQRSGRYSKARVASNAY